MHAYIQIKPFSLLFKFPRLQAMEIKGGGGGMVAAHWRFQPNESLMAVSSHSIRGVLYKILTCIDNNENEEGDEHSGAPRNRTRLRPSIRIPLGHGDPSAFPCFQTTPAAVDAVVSSLRSGRYNSYAPCVGVPSARRAIAEYLSFDLPYELSPDDVYLTNGCAQAIEIVISVLARPGANILLPSPGYQYYAARAAHGGLEVRYFHLLPEKNWEVDLAALEALADENTVAMVIVNPGNPCGNTFTYHHLAEVAETAKKLGILVIADEVYGHLTFGPNPFVAMGVFGEVVPVLTLGSVSKRWLVPGWRLGWIAANDPNGVLQQTKIMECLKNCLDISCDPATFVQGAIPQIIENTNNEFFDKTIDLLRRTADICYDKLQEIDCINCKSKPEASMFVMVKLNLSLLEGIHDDMDFCVKLAKEQNVIILPGCAVGLKNWLRITFAVEPSSLEEGLERLTSFCLEHSSQIARECNPGS